jgi:hypothetical protein
MKDENTEYRCQDTGVRSQKRRKQNTENRMQETGINSKECEVSGVRRNTAATL